MPAALTKAISKIPADGIMPDAREAKGLSAKLIDKLIETWSVPESVVAIG